MENHKKERVKIVIPVYTDNLNVYEQISLKQLCQVMGSYDILFVKPLSLSEERLNRLAPKAGFESFPDEYFSDIKSYNRLMLSSEFYYRFLSCEYILIYQLDSYVFKDSLIEWCSKGFDYVGAPWIKRSVYNRFPINIFIAIERYINSTLLGRPDRQKLFNQVGNGGFSLRKVSSHYLATVECREKIEEFSQKRQFHLFNEDVFWSVEVNNHLKNKFIYPHYIRALEFSFDKHPEYCYNLNGKKLPFGCHGWSKREMIGFWKSIISVV